MSTHYVDRLNAFHDAATRALRRAEIVGIPMTPRQRGDAADNFLAGLKALTAEMDLLLADLLRDADDHIGAMTITERWDSTRIVSTAIEGEHDYAFARFVEDVRAGIAA